ncbi:WD repeat-containing protein 75 [Cimex lectularius]|uniref:WD repeat-containing protein 75 second beta-propeller domain-containing protein n=1 Tax=Cimex lectularius TaxID=79782 RepID=A0A8I6RHR8_CIMLE|nr:WD repeat-containing protein 75 [Cimex lectularius]
MAIKMKAKKKNNHNSNSGITTRRRGGGTLIESRPVFSSDSKHVYLNCGWGVKVFSVVTGECVKALEVENNEGRVKAVLYYDGQAGAVTSDGKVTFWKASSSKVSFSYNLQVKDDYTVANAFLVRSLQDEMCEDMCVLFSKNKARVKTSVKFYNPSDGTLKNHPLNKLMMTDSVSPHCISYGGSEKWPFIASISSNTVNIYPLNGQQPILGISPIAGRKWTCVRCHPCDDILAAGDDLGRVILMRSTLPKGGPKSVYHWHTLPCNEIAFTPAGSSMYTGGGENVLVKWNIENPYMRNYLPRLSSHIVYISVSHDNQLVALATLDNGVQIVSSTNKLQCVLQQLSWSILPSNWLKPFPAGLVYDPRSQSIFLNGRPGHLQLYSPQSETLVQIIDVTMHNYLTQERNKLIVNTEVIKCALSDDGVWLATVEMREDKDVATEIRMKLWQYLLAKKCFSLNSSIELPHEVSLNALIFKPGLNLLTQNDSDQPLDYMVVTTGGDKKARIWAPNPLDSVYRKGVIWECINTCHYREMDCGPCSFSYDGSLLAVAFGTSLTLWDVDNIALKESLSRGSERIKFVEFGRRDCCHLVMSTTQTEVSVWDLLTLSLTWSLKLNVDFLIPDPFSNNMAIFTEDNKLFIFHPTKNEAVYVNEELCTLGTKAAAGVFLPRDLLRTEGASWLSNSQLFYIDTNQEMHAFEFEKEYEYSVGGAQHFSLDDKTESLTPFGCLLASQQKTTAVQRKASHAPGGRTFASSAAINQLLKSGAHTLPPMSLICGGLLRTLVTLKESATQPNEKQAEEKMEVDESSSSEDETSSPRSSKGSRAPRRNVRKPEETVDLNALFPEASFDFDNIEETDQYIIDEGGHSNA